MSANAPDDLFVERAAYTFPNTDAMIAYLEGRGAQDEYGRYGSPGERVVEQELATLDKAETALLFANGMTAMRDLFAGKLSAGDHVVITDESYHRTRRFLDEHVKRWGISTTQVETGDFDAMDAAIRPETKLLLTESPTNPHLTVVDMERFAEVGKRRGVETVVDATLATPYNIRPLDYGVDMVMHSVTKYLNGNNDILAGVITGSKARLQAVLEMRKYGGGSGVHNARLIHEHLQDFEERMETHNHNGQAIAEFLERDKRDKGRIRHVYYPGLENHPQHSIAKKQMRGFGGMVTFRVNADRLGTRRFLDALKIPQIGPSIGAPMSLMQMPRDLNHWTKTDEQCAQIGITNDMVRYSAGREDTDALIQDLDQALDAAKNS